MTGNGKRWLAAATVVTFAALFVGAGVRLSSADEPKAADLTDLRDAVKAASQRGDNVDEVEKALAALEKAMGAGFKAEPGKDPPAELTALRNAVEAAARKGENVEEIRKQLAEVEKKLVGRELQAPKPVEPPLGDPPAPERPLRRFPRDFPVPPPQIEFPPFPEFPNRGLGGLPGIDREALQKAQELQRKAMDLLLKDPNDAEAQKLTREAMELMLKGVANGRGGIIAPEMLFQELEGLGRAPERFRLGIRMEKVTPVLVEQLGLEAGRGIVVADVIAGSAAEKAGFKAADVVVEFAGKPVSDQPEEFNKLVTGVKAGERVDAVVLRKGKKVEIKGIELPEADRELPARPGRRLPQPRFDLRPLPAQPVPAVPGAGGLSLNLSNGNFAIKSTRDGVTYDLKGTVENGASKLTEVTIEADGKATKYESLEKVPDEHRPAVEQLLKRIGAGAEPRLRPRVKD